MLNVVIGQYSFIIPPTSNLKYSGEEYAEMIRRRFDNPQSFEAAKYAAENIAYIYRKGSVIHYGTVRRTQQ